jgi:hypothetical protein
MREKFFEGGGGNWNQLAQDKIKFLLPNLKNGAVLLPALGMLILTIILTLILWAVISGL